MVFRHRASELGKTEVLRALNGHANVVLLSSLTPSTFISGKSIKGKNQSLLPKLNGKLVVIKDFTTLLTQHREARAEIFSQLREIYDGQYAKAFGTGESVSWSGKLGIIAGVTPVIDKYMSVNQMLGERFLHYRVGDEDAFGVGCCAFDHVLSEDKNRREFQESVGQFLSQFDGNVSLSVEDMSGLRDRIVHLATFCAHARSAVFRNPYDGTLQVMPQPEGPARLTKQFKMLALALAVVRGSPGVDDSVYEIVKKTARDTLPRLRLHLLETLWDLHLEKPHKMFRSKEVALAADVPTNTAKHNLENLALLRLVERDTESDGNTAAYTWQPSDLMGRLVDASQCFA